jgi:hypothetical protein
MLKLLALRHRNTKVFAVRGGGVMENVVHSFGALK